MGACVQSGRKETETGEKDANSEVKQRQEEEKRKMRLKRPEYDGICVEDKRTAMVEGRGRQTGGRRGSGRAREKRRERERERARWWARTASDQNALVGRELGGRGRRRDER